MLLALGGPGRSAFRTLMRVEEQLLAVKRIARAKGDAIHVEEGAEERGWVEQLTREAMLGLLPPGSKLEIDLADREKTRELPTVVAALLICQGFCGDAIREERAGDLPAAWECNGSATYWLGVSDGIAYTLTESAQKHFDSWLRSRRSREQFALNAEAKAWAQEAYKRDGAAYRSAMAFARYAERYVLTHYGITVTAEHIRDSWLKAKSGR